MSNELFPIEQTEILHFDKKKNKRVNFKQCNIISNFLFNKNEFYLTYKSGYFFVCLSHKGELILVWYKKEKENNEKITSGEVMSLFRKLYLKNNITQDKLELFINNPLEYQKLYPKSK